MVHQAVCQPGRPDQNIGPVLFRTRLVNPGIAELRPAVSKYLLPLVRHLFASIDSAQQRTGDGGISIGVSTAKHGADNALFYARSVQHHVEGVL